MKKKRIWQGGATVMASLLMVSTAAQITTNNWSARINSMLGTSNYETVTGESQSGTHFVSEFSSLGDMLDAQKEFTAEISAEGSVLLKNENNALPLKSSSEKVTLWGMHTNAPILGGMMGSTSSANTDAGQTLYGIKEAMTEKGFDLNQNFIDFYAGEDLDDYRMEAMFFGNPVPNHSMSAVFTTLEENFSTYNVGEAPASEYSEDLLKTADDTTAIVLISRDSSEAADYHPDMTSEVDSDSFERPLALSQNERDMIELAKEHSSKVIVLLNTSSTMEIEELKQDEGIDSILWVGQPGTNGFLGVADVLSGAVSPSGKLTDTYSSSTVSSPAMVNFGVYLYTVNSFNDSSISSSDQGDAYAVETEGIYQGYKYYETRYEDAVLGNGNATDGAGSTSGTAWDYAKEMSYPFGYGLSYTTFEQKIKSVDLSVGDMGTAVVEVKNTGDVAGKDVAELYVQAPYTPGGLEKAAVQLIGFAKTDTLEPGETEEVTVTFDPRYIASYDDSAVKENGTEGAWVLDAGDYYFTIGNGTHNAINNILAAKLKNTDELVTITSDETIDADNVKVWNLEQRDVETYSENVENALQNMDINKLIPGAAEYTTRSDWTKGWTPVMDLTPTDDMHIDLSNTRNALTENGDGVTWGADNGLNIINFIETDENGVYTGTVPIDDPRWQQLVEQVTLEDAVNFIENAGNGLNRIENINYPANAIQDGPTGIANDQVAAYYVKWAGGDPNEATYVGENDEYAGYSMNVLPTEPVAASTFNQDLIEREGEMYGEISLWSNIPGILAPGVNLHRVPYCGRNHEYYSEDPMVTNIMTTAFCTGGTKKGLMTEPKHLAFNHQEANRSGISVFMTEQSARETELRCFEGALSSNAAMGVMTSYNRVGAVYASAHSGLLEQILRNEWGFEGWIVTDMAASPDYMNWLDSISNGTSGMLTTSSSTSTSKFGSMTSQLDKIKKDTVFQEKMQQGLKYYFYATARSNALNGITEDTTVKYVRTWWQNAITGVEIVSAVLMLVFLGMYFAGKRKKTGGEEE